ncbi:MAG: hypothetical protein KGH93_00885 [Patescibacteria group bacterium]|nr:hypothetical protein [Patescibacteria group bacterium]MDE1945735.1 hypothetical protein [Patescibacteria group bacterium]
MDLMNPSQRARIETLAGRIAKTIVAQAEDRYTSHNAAEFLKNRNKFENAVRETIDGMSGFDEEMKSEYGYPAGYRFAKPVEEQIKRLRKLFPGIADDTDPRLSFRVKSRPFDLPDGAEGWFAVPNWRAYSEIFGERYDQAAEKVFSVIPQIFKSGFDADCEYLKEKKDKEKRASRKTWLHSLLSFKPIGPGFQYLRENILKETLMIDLVARQQYPSILLFPAQFGICHRGESNKRALRFGLSNGEFGLGAFEIGCMLLTHPERLINQDNLGIDCAGDELYPWPDTHKHRGVYFDYRGDMVRFSWKSGEESSACPWSGSATLFAESPRAVFDLAYKRLNERTKASR